MSNLNINNIDVQRIINLLNELKSKIDLCSILTFKTVERTLISREEIINAFQSDELIKDFENHYKFMINFKTTHLEYTEDESKESEKSNEVKEDEVLDAEDQNQNQDKVIKRENLKDIDGIFAYI